MQDSPNQQHERNVTSVERKPPRWVTLVTAGLGFVTALYGVWAFALPHSFFEVIATFEPYNRHFTHDSGALQIGIGVALMLAAARRPAVVAALGGFVVFEGLHVVSHVIDRDLGGNPAADIPFLTLLALLGAAALAGTTRRSRNGRT